MAEFKKFFKQIHNRDCSKVANAATFKGSSYKCQVKIKDGGEMKICGCEIPCRNFATTGLKQHIRDNHAAQYEEVTMEKDSKSIAKMLGVKDAIDQKQRENIALTWAKNGLVYIHETQRLQLKEEGIHFGKIKGRNVFLLVDGGTMNRKRHLNASIGTEGQ
eukprot:gene9198-2459_t